MSAGIVGRLHNAAWHYLRMKNPQWGTMKRVAIEYDVPMSSLSRAIGRIKNNLKPPTPEKYQRLFLVYPAWMEGEVH